MTLLLNNKLIMIPPFSVLEGIEDNDFAIVVDYFELKLKEYTFKRTSFNHNFTDMVNYGNYSIGFTINNKIAIYDNDNYITIIEINKKIFAENIEGLFNSIQLFSVERNLK